MKTAILFDLDGTLLDSLEDLKDSVNATLEMYGCPKRTLEQVRQFVGNGAEVLIRLALPGTENDPPVAEVLAAYQAYYATHSRIKTRPYPGILEALRELAAEFPVGIVSNKPDPAVKSLCAEYFPGIYALGERADCPRKPAPDMLYRAMEELQVQRCVYVGDSEVDVITARNAGVPCLSVLWGFRDKQTILEAGGQVFCQQVEQMPAILRSMM